MFSKGQYRQVDSRLHGHLSIRLDRLSCVLVLVEAGTWWSERFLFRRSPKTSSDSSRGRDVSVLPKISQLLVIVSFMGGLRGL